ncbi:hypothetical protein CERZMDRAFT_91810, partial [Cercospora zeae-maydis SCOH1-5]
MKRRKRPVGRGYAVVTVVTSVEVTVLVNGTVSGIVVEVAISELTTEVAVKVVVVVVLVVRNVAVLDSVTETTPLNDVTVNVAVTVTTELVGRRHRQASITPSSPYFLRRTGRQALTCLRTIPTEPSSSSLPEGAEVGKGVVLAEFGHVYWVLVLSTLVVTTPARLLVVPLV